MHYFSYYKLKNIMSGQIHHRHFFAVCVIMKFLPDLAERLSWTNLKSSGVKIVLLSGPLFELTDYLFT